MNRTKIEWADRTWNPITGCLHNCSYCYARRIAERFGGYNNGVGTITTHNPLPRAELHQPLTITRSGGKTVNSPFPFGFEPTLLYYRLEEPKRIKKPRNIFVCSIADLFGEWVPDKWIAEVFKACRLSPQHRYLFLTKNPARYMKLAEAGMLPEEENFWYGSSVPTPEATFWWSDRHNTFVSIEPMMQPFTSDDCETIKKANWIIVGAMNGPGWQSHQPKKEWIESLKDDALRAGVPLFMKDSLLPIVGEANMLRQFPWNGGDEQ